MQSNDKQNDQEEEPPHSSSQQPSGNLEEPKQQSPVDVSSSQLRRVFVANLVEYTTKEDLERDLVACFGPTLIIEHVHLVPKKFAFVTFSNSEDVKRLLEAQTDRFDIRKPTATTSKKNNSNDNPRNSKKRPKDVRIHASQKICLTFIAKGHCDRHGCRFSHDLLKFMQDRHDDIVSDTFKLSSSTAAENGETDVVISHCCPNYQNFGYCRYGAMCRIGNCHIDPTTGENKRDPKSSLVPSGDDKSHVPLLPKKVRTQLCKKKYKFDYESHQKEDRQQVLSTTEATDLTPASKSHGFASPITTKTKKRIDFENKIYVAPLTTVGNLPFRRIMKIYGADITCGEMALCSSLLQGNNSEWALLKKHESEDIFGVQLAGAHVDQFAKTSELIQRYAPHVDFIDINLGCPLDLICKKGAGAGLLLKGGERKLRDIVIGMSNALETIPITIKMRTGWDMDKPTAHLLVPKITSWAYDHPELLGGISAIMLHGRSRLQRYNQLANWDYIQETALASSSIETSQAGLLPSSVPIIGNGDIFSYIDYEQKVLSRCSNQNVGESRTSTNCLSKTAMLGRGALIKPWLPTEIKERRHWDISATERLDILKEYVRFGLEHWGSDQQGVDNTRRYLLEWLSFLYRYIPVGLLEIGGELQKLNTRPTEQIVSGRSDLETLFLSPRSEDWIKISEILLGQVPENFRFEPKHKAKG